MNKGLSLSQPDLTEAFRTVGEALIRKIQETPPPSKRRKG